MGYKIILPEIYTIGEDRIIEAQNQIKDLVSRMPIDSYIQRLDALIPYNFNGSQLPDKTFLQQSYKKHISNRLGYKMYSYLFFSTPVFDTFISTFRNPLKLNIKEGIRADNFINDSFKSVVTQEVNTLNKSKIFQCIALSEEEMKYFNFLYFNLWEEKYSNDVNLYANIKHKDKSINIQVGDNFVGGFSLYTEKQLPNELPQITSDKLMTTQSKDFPIALGDIFGIYMQVPHIISTIICRNDINVWKQSLKKKSDTYMRMALAGAVYKEKAEEINNINKKISSDYNDTLFVQSNTNVFFWSNDIKEFSIIKDNIAGYFNQQNIAPKYITGKHLRNIFIGTNPIYMCANNDATMYPTLLEIPISFIPIVGSYNEDAEGCYFTDRFNIPLKIDLWDKRKKYIKARNFIMVAPTGEGKSFLLMDFLRQQQELGMVIVIIDLGKSFRRYAKLLGEKASFIEYDNDTPLGLNPFACTIEELQQTDKLNSLSDFVLAHLNISKEIQETDKIFLTSILRDYINTQNNLSFPKFIKWIIDTEPQILKTYHEQLDFFNFKEMKIFLKEFIDNGRYAFLYKGKENTEIADNLKNKSVVVFEIDKAQNDFKILSVILQSIKDTIYTNIWSDKSKRGVILFEEFAKILNLQGGSILRQVEFYFQAIRKQEGSIGIVLQEVSQIPENATAQSIFGNTHILFALQHKKTDIDRFFNRLIKDDNFVQRNQMLSLKSNFEGNNKYSEVFIRRGDHSNIYRVNVSREQYLTYLTDGEENVKIEQLIKNGLTVESAVKKLL